MKLNPLDQLNVAGKDYIYRDGNWTTPSGMCVPTAYGQTLTLAFYQKFGRGPCMAKPEPVKRTRAVTQKLLAAKRTTAKPAAERHLVREPRVTSGAGALR